MNSEPMKPPEMTMNNDPINSFDKLGDFLAESRDLSKQALGFRKTTEYKQVLFNVSPRFVIADLSPLAYLDLVQEVSNGQVQAAVVILYERLRPLLECKHKWLPLGPDADSRILSLNLGLSLGTTIHTCRSCTAYGLETVEASLPFIGRDVDMTMGSSGRLDRKDP
ncbi:hypothetical protein [Granulicella sibirica]|uniref:hypothetical protein n=1 Tax=Granulicella sibirica TaxID=2479048 RepID=UPI00100902A5|nr:hypothetical protein [Granulicella sibirica]